jgi:hypothetical protein
MRGIVGGAEPGGLLDSNTGPVAGPKWMVAYRAIGPDGAGATSPPIRCAAAVADCRNAASCAAQSWCDTASILTPVEEGASSSHCSAAAEPWCAELVSADQPQTIAHSTRETGTAARTTSATTLIRCFQLTIRVYPAAAIIGLSRRL